MIFIDTWGYLCFALDYRSFCHLFYLWWWFVSVSICCISRERPYSIFYRATFTTFLQILEPRYGVCMALASHILSYLFLLFFYLCRRYIWTCCFHTCKHLKIRSWKKASFRTKGRPSEADNSPVWLHKFFEKERGKRKAN